MATSEYPQKILEARLAMLKKMRTGIREYSTYRRKYIAPSLINRRNNDDPLSEQDPESRRTSKDLYNVIANKTAEKVPVAYSYCIYRIENTHML